MPVQSITVPYRVGYEYGQGVDLATGSPMAHVVTGAAMPPAHAPGSSMNFTVQRINSTTDMESALGISVEASYGSAAFGAGISARFDFAKNSKIQSSSLFVGVTLEISLAALSINDALLHPDAAALVDNPGVFALRYGDMFVRAITRGGLFVGVMRVDTSSSQESNELAAALQGSYGLFSADAKTHFQDAISKYRSEVYVQIWTEGGPGDLKITDPQDPMQLLDNANKFVQAFHDTPDEVAHNYEVLLSPVTIATGPLPPNAVDIQHSMDIVCFCAKRRSVILDQLNLLQFILDHKDRFDFTQGASVVAVEAAAANVQADLDLVADCASEAINHPSKRTKMPKPYAEAQGTNFPSAAMPDPMPVTKGGVQTVNVPDFTACASLDACQALAAESHLALQVQYEHETALDLSGHFHVRNIVPAKDTPVAEGSVVTIVLPPLLPVFVLPDFPPG